LQRVSGNQSVTMGMGCSRRIRHRAIGRMKVLNVPIPAFDINDEWFD
jgi:hypothetical protein